jgi:hypothetical protein
MRIRERYELASELKERYRQASKRERSELLDAFCLASGYERKHAIKVLGGRRRKSAVSIVRPRRRRYGLAFQKALKVAWEAAGYICSERLQPYLPDVVALLKRHGQLEVDAATESLLESASVATIERNLAQLRRGLVGRKMSQTKPGSLLRKQIPVVVGKWKELDQPGYLEIDLVSHSGEFAVGEWIWTLCATDLSTGWSGCRSWVTAKSESSPHWSESVFNSPSLCWAFIPTTAASSSTTTSSSTAAVTISTRRSCSRARGQNTRTTTLMSNRRTGPWFAASSVTRDSTRRSNWLGSIASTPSCCGHTTTASSQS